MVDTIRVLATLPSDSLGAYIISMAQTASDVLVVELLQKELGLASSLRVVPLFETLGDLELAPDTMTRLFSSSWYHAHINGHQVRRHSAALKRARDVCRCLHRAARSAAPDRAARSSPCARPGVHDRVQRLREGRWPPCGCLGPLQGAGGAHLDFG